MVDVGDLGLLVIVADAVFVAVALGDLLDDGIEGLLVPAFFLLLGEAVGEVGGAGGDA